LLAPGPSQPRSVLPISHTPATTETTFTYHQQYQQQLKQPKQPFTLFSAISATIQQKEGIDNLLESLEVELKRRAETRLGIIVDADTDIDDRWQSLRYRLTEAGYIAVPLHPAPGGTILKQEGWPVVGLWLMPDNTIPGILEDFIGLLIPAGDMLWPMAQDVVL
jgi:hypothetical protein